MFEKTLPKETLVLPVALAERTKHKFPGGGLVSRLFVGKYFLLKLLYSTQNIKDLQITSSEVKR